LASLIAFDYINPGLGGSIQCFRDFTPVYNKKSVTDIQKNIEVEEKIGKGASEPKFEDTSLNQDEPDEPDEILQLNQSVLSKLDKAHVSSFLKPKFVETKTIEFSKQKKVKTENVKTEKTNPQKPINIKQSHKFQFF